MLGIFEQKHLRSTNLSLHDSKQHPKTAFAYTGMGVQDRDNQIMFQGLISRAESQQAYMISQTESIVIEEVFRHK